MKLGKTSWLILCAGIFIVVVVSLGLTRSQQVKEQSRLDEELSIAEMRLDKLQVKQLQHQQAELEGQLDESTIQLIAVKDKMRQAVESINVTDEFFGIAQSCGVEIMVINSSAINKEELDNITHSKITLNSMVEGEVSNLISFIIKLNNDFTTGIVQSAQLTIPEADDEDRPSATILMVVYTYEGD